MNQNLQGGLHAFKMAQFLGPPKIFPPTTKDKIPAVVKFIIPQIKFGSLANDQIISLARQCGIELFGVDTERATNERTKEPAMLVTFAFYVSATVKGDKTIDVITETSRLLIERFLGLLSFFAGAKLSAIHAQTITKKGKELSTILSPIFRVSMPPITLTFPANIENVQPHENVLSALVWLRRGLAERDPVETFSALMVCLQIMARHLVVQKEPIQPKCPNCGGALEFQEPSITSLVRELVISKLGASPELFNRLWKARNAIVSHGNQPLTPKALLELTKLKFNAAILGFNSIKLGLKMPFDAPPFLNKEFFVTDLFMYVD